MIRYALASIILRRYSRRIDYTRYRRMRKWEERAAGGPGPYPWNTAWGRRIPTWQAIREIGGFVESHIPRGARNGIMRIFWSNLRNFYFLSKT